MKKTIVVLFALSGVASAATLAKIDTTDENLVSYVDFSSTPFATTAGKIKYTNLPTLENGYGIIQVDGNHDMKSSNASAAGFTSSQAFTLSFDVRSFGTGDLFTLAVHNGANWKKIVLTTETLDNAALTLEFYGNEQELATNLSHGTRTEWSTITLVGDTSVKQGVKLYVDGSLVGSLDMTQATNWTGDPVSGFQFGSSYGDMGIMNDLKGTAEIDNLLVYKRAFTAAEVKALTVAHTVPEPATATLSLLALAGLAARRRRK